MQTSTSSLRGIPGPHSPPRDGTLGTLLAAPSRRPPLIAASCASRSKLTFCTLHYAPARVPRGLRPAPAHADNLIGQLIFAARGPRRPPPAPAGPGLCAASAGRGPGRSPGLLALIRRPRRRLCHAGSPAAPSRTPSAHPRPLGSVHLSEPRDAPRRRAGGGVPWTGKEPAPLHPAPHVSEAPPFPETREHTRAHTRGGLPIKERGNDERESAPFAQLGRGESQQGPRTESRRPPPRAPQVWRLVSSPNNWGGEGREGEIKVSGNLPRTSVSLCEFLGVLLEVDTPPSRPQPPPPRKATE